MDGLITHEGQENQQGRDRRGAYGVMHSDNRTGGMPFEFVAMADFAPYAVRRAAFLDVGGLDEALAEPGECGIMSDYELSLRFWASGWQARERSGSAAAGWALSRCGQLLWAARRAHSDALDQECELGRSGALITQC